MRPCKPGLGSFEGNFFRLVLPLYYLIGEIAVIATDVLDASCLPKKYSSLTVSLVMTTVEPR